MAPRAPATFSLGPAGRAFLRLPAARHPRRNDPGRELESKALALLRGVDKSSFGPEHGAPLCCI
eukprot:5611949-Pyramimonas_sp.AAC.1